MILKLATVEELLLGSDGKVRVAIVKVASSDGKPQILCRSVKHLFPIEVRSELTQTPNINNSPSPIPESNERSSRGQPRRQAAMLGEAIHRMK